MQSMLEILNLTVVRGQGPGQHSISLPALSLASGDVWAVTGESGCGKSTLLEAIGLLLKPETIGHFELGRTDVAALIQQGDEPALARLRAEKLGFVLQQGGLLPFLSIRDNIALPRRLLGLPAWSERLAHCCATLRLEAALDKRPAALSIGERQRAAFIRAIAHEPDLLLADEPTAALDPHHAYTLLELFLALVREMGMAALIVSHDWPLVQGFGLPRITACSMPGATTFELVG